MPAAATHRRSTTSRGDPQQEHDHRRFRADHEAVQSAPLQEVALVEERLPPRLSALDVQRGPEFRRHEVRPDDPESCRVDRV